MKLLDLFSGNIIDNVAGAVKNYVNKDERLKQLDIKKQEAILDFEDKQEERYSKQMLGQMEINKEEAKSPHWFVASWRPAIGWVGALALTYQFLIYPFLIWLWTLAQALGWLSDSIDYPPILDIDALWTVIVGMLGIGTMRSFDKINGVDTKKVIL